MSSSSSPPALNTVPPSERIVATNEKVTGPPAAEMLRRSGIQSSDLNHLSILDNACGGGVLSFSALDVLLPENIGRIVAGDIDDTMLDYVRKKRDGGEPTRLSKIEVMKIDQQAVDLPDASFTHIFNNFGVFFCPSDSAVLAETFRMLRRGGTAGFTSWFQITWWSSVAMPALAAFVPDAPALPDPTQIFPTRGWSDPAAIPAKLKQAGFVDVQVDEYRFNPVVEAPEFAAATAVLVKAITKKIWSEEENARFGDRLEPAILQHLIENFPNGRWDGMMTAGITIARKV